MMNRVRLSVLAAAAAMSLAGCAAGDKAATAVQGAVQAQTTPTLSTTDATFFDLASRAGIEEVTFGQLARDQAGRQSVKAFAVRMVDEQTALNQQLTRLAQTKGVTPPDTMDTTHTDAFARLQTLHGRAFDVAYLNGQATDHAATLKLFQNEAQTGADPDVKAFAQNTIPTLQMHLDTARRLGGRVMRPAS